MDVDGYYYPDESSQIPPDYYSQLQAEHDIYVGEDTYGEYGQGQFQFRDSLIDEYGNDEEIVINDEWNHNSQEGDEVDEDQDAEEAWIPYAPRADQNAQRGNTQQVIIGGGGGGGVSLPWGFPNPQELTSHWCDLYPLECAQQRFLRPREELQGRNASQPILEQGNWVGGVERLRQVDLSGLGLALMLMVLVLLGLNVGWDKETKKSKDNGESGRSGTSGEKSSAGHKGKASSREGDESGKGGSKESGESTKGKGKDKLPDGKSQPSNDQNGKEKKSSLDDKGVKGSAKKGEKEGNRASEEKTKDGSGSGKAKDGPKGDKEETSRSSRTKSEGSKPEESSSKKSKQSGKEPTPPDKQGEKSKGEAKASEGNDREKEKAKREAEKKKLKEGENDARKGGSRDGQKSNEKDAAAKGGERATQSDKEKERAKKEKEKEKEKEKPKEAAKSESEKREKEKEKAAKAAEQKRQGEKEKEKGNEKGKDRQKKELEKNDKGKDKDKDRAAAKEAGQQQQREKDKASGKDKDKDRSKAKEAGSKEAEGKKGREGSPKDPKEAAREKKKAESEAAGKDKKKEGKGEQESDKKKRREEDNQGKAGKKATDSKDGSDKFTKSKSKSNEGDKGSSPETSTTKPKGSKDTPSSWLTPQKLLIGLLVLIPLLAILSGNNRSIRSATIVTPPSRNRPPSTTSSRWIVNERVPEPPRQVINNVHAQGSDIPINIGTDGSVRGPPVVIDKSEDIFMDMPAASHEIYFTGPVDPDRFYGMIIALGIVGLPLLLGWTRGWPERNYTEPDYLSATVHYLLLALLGVFLLWKFNQEFGYMSHIRPGITYIQDRALNARDSARERLPIAISASAQGAETLIWDVEDLLFGEGRTLLGLLGGAISLMFLSQRPPPIRSSHRSPKYAEGLVQILYVLGSMIFGLLFMNA